ncbi:MAG TPA: hypothetical protein PK595_06545 [Bacteroidota bacterium]|nr:hypothetical protein [Bacteroidota bacterium]
MHIHYYELYRGLHLHAAEREIKPRLCNKGKKSIVSKRDKTGCFENLSNHAPASLSNHASANLSNQSDSLPEALEGSANENKAGSKLCNKGKRSIVSKRDKTGCFKNLSNHAASVHLSYHAASVHLSYQSDSLPEALEGSANESKDKLS